MSRLAAFAVPVAVSLVALTAACSGPGAPAASPATSVPASSAAATATESPTSRPNATATTQSPQARSRTKAELEDALLTLDDMPSGFSAEPVGSDEGGAPRITSTNPKCAEFVKYSNAEKAPGSLASASASFSGGQDGPYIDEYLDALGKPANVAALHKKLKAAVASCSKVTLTLPGVGKSTMLVRAVKAPAVGDAPVAFRVTADGGALDGFELTQVLVGASDVEMTMVFIGAYPEEIEGATQAAHEKATAKLGVSAGQLSS
ncbi:hypothetical protein [Intrasporangium mesophilum]